MAISAAQIKDIDKYFAAKQYDRAIKLLHEIMTQNPKDLSIKLKLADAFYLWGKKKNAVDLLRKVAIEYARRGFMSKALAVKNKIARIDPHDNIDLSEFATKPEPPVQKKETEEAESGVNLQTVLKSLFGDLSDDKIDEIYSKLVEYKTKVGEVIFEEGDSSDSMYIITRGAVKVVMNHEGTVMELAVLKEGNYFGEVALLSGKSRTASVICSENSTFFILEKREFKALNNKYPMLRENLAATVENRAQSVIDKILKKGK